ncbi:MAG: Asp-tRNA(Asn)/Glu-tRNA(Gln) amidotransferase subunit GatC [Eubacteriales bacterium]
MTIDNNLITYLESLGRIELTEEEREKCGKNLADILSYMDTLNELDTAGVEPLSHSFPITNVLREDIVINSADRELLLSNAPRQKDGCFKVPKTVE